MRHALAALAGIAVGLPVLASLASRQDGQPAGGLPARFVPWARVGHRFPTAFADPRATQPMFTRRPPTSGPARTPQGPAAQTMLRGPLTAPFHRPGPTARRGPGQTTSPVAGRTAAQAPGRTPSQRPAGAPSPYPAETPVDPPPHYPIDHPAAEAARHPADLELSMVAPPTVRPGGRFSYSVRLTNHGPGTPGPITVRSVLPSGTVRTGAWLPPGVDGYTGSRDAALVVHRLEPGRSLAARFDVRVLPETRGELVTRGRIAAVGGALDNVPDDDAAQVSTVVRPR